LSPVLKYGGKKWRCAVLKYLEIMHVSKKDFAQVVNTFLQISQTHT